MLQANGGEDIFFEEADRRHFIGLIVGRYFARHVATLSNEGDGPLKDQTKTNISENIHSARRAFDRNQNTESLTTKMTPDLKARRHLILELR